MTEKGDFIMINMQLLNETVLKTVKTDLSLSFAFFWFISWFYVPSIRQKVKEIYENVTGP